MAEFLIFWILVPSLLLMLLYTALVRTYRHFKPAAPKLKNDTPQLYTSAEPYSLIPGIITTLLLAYPAYVGWLAYMLIATYTTDQYGIIAKAYIVIFPIISIALPWLISRGINKAKTNYGTIRQTLATLILTAGALFLLLIVPLFMALTFLS